MPLPIVKHELFYSTLASMYEDDNFSENIYHKIKKENPVIFILVEAVVDNPDMTPDFQDGYVKALAQVYYLLSAQAECDDL